MPARKKSTKPTRARKTSLKLTRIWKFSARVETPEVVHEILIKYNRYYNKLVEIERARHACFLASRRTWAPDLAVLEDEWLRLDDQVSALYAEAKKSRQTYWRETSGEKVRLLPPEYEGRKAELDAQKKVVSASASELRATFSALLDPAYDELKRRVDELANGRGPRTRGVIRPEVLAQMLDEPQWSDAWKEIARSDRAAHKATLKARAVCGLHGGTYLAVEEAVDASKKDSSPRPPRFRSFSGCGRIRLQMDKGTLWGTMKEKRLQIESLVPRPGAGKRSNMIRIHMDQTREKEPSTKCSFTAKLHRPIPATAEVKWVTLMVRQHEGRAHYQFQLTLEHESFSEPKRPSGAAPTDHVRIGWSRTANGIRVGKVGGTEIVCPSSILQRASYSESIDSGRDRIANSAIRRLRLVARMSGLCVEHRTWLRMLSDYGRNALRKALQEFVLMTWPVEEVRRRWRSWVLDRKPRKEDLYVDVSELRATMTPREAFVWWVYLWLRKDEHLETFCGDMRRKFVNSRDMYYRHEAIRLATQYAELTIDDFSIADLKKLEPLTMPGTGVRDAAQSQLQAAAPGRFREILCEVMGPRCVLRERPGDVEKSSTARVLKSEEKS